MQKLIGVYYDDLEGSLSTKKAGCKIDISFATEKICCRKNQVARLILAITIEKIILL